MLEILNCRKCICNNSFRESKLISDNDNFILNCSKNVINYTILNKNISNSFISMYNNFFLISLYKGTLYKIYIKLVIKRF